MSARLLESSECGGGSAWLLVSTIVSAAGIRNEVEPERSTRKQALPLALTLDTRPLSQTWRVTVNVRDTDQTKADLARFR